ncbi:hypothetical protein M2432_004504 [Mycobacterium sp. OTB74]|nr:hypothetical protein [Mycobacterium sp. OTB74]
MSAYHTLSDLAPLARSGGYESSRPLHTFGADRRLGPTDIFAAWPSITGTIVHGQ